jgi:undecaprenyl-diphosphatase
VLNLGADIVDQRPIVRADVAVANLLYGLRTPLLDRVMMTASALGDGGQRTAVTVLVTLYLAWRRRFRWALAFALVMAGAAAATPVFKTAFHVARPSALYSGADAYSFPSGHATSAAALYLTLGWMASRALARRWRPAVWIVALAAILVTAVSRVYLGAHWPSDVIAGMALGAALASLAIAFAASAKPPTAVGRQVLDGPAFVVALTLVGVVLGPAAVTKAHRLYGPYLSAGPTLREAASPTGAPVSARRIDLLGHAEEPFVALWRAPPAALETRLRGDGWRSAPSWSWRGALAALDGGTDLRRLPPPRVLHEGRTAALTMVAPGASENERRVLRLWPAGPGGAVYVGSLTREAAIRPLRLLTLLSEDDTASLGDPLLASVAPLASTAAP